MTHSTGKINIPLRGSRGLNMADMADMADLVDTADMVSVADMADTAGTVGMADMTAVFALSPSLSRAKPRDHIKLTPRSGPFFGH